MSKRRAERDIETISSATLAALDPDERLQLFLEGEAADKDRWCDLLWDTCPKREYRMLDLAYTERIRLAIFFRQLLLSELHTTLLERELLWEQQYAALMGERSDGGLEEVCARDDRITHLNGALYTQYHASARFAEEHLGVSLETWFVPHPYGEAVLTDTMTTLDRMLNFDGAEPLEQAINDVLGIESDDTDDWVTLEELVDARYTVLAEQWTETLETGTI